MRWNGSALRTSVTQSEEMTPRKQKSKAESIIARAHARHVSTFRMNFFIRGVRDRFEIRRKTGENCERAFRFAKGEFGHGYGARIKNAVIQLILFTPFFGEPVFQSLSRRKDFAIDWISQSTCHSLHERACVGPIRIIHERETDLRPIEIYYLHPPTVLHRFAYAIDLASSR